jgi:hypothetical protein
MAILELPEVKAALSITGGAKDVELQSVIDGVLEGVNVMCGYSESTAFTEWRQSVNGFIIVRRRPLLAITSVTGQTYGALTVANLFFADETSVIRSKANTSAILDDWYQVVYSAGRAAIPPAIKRGAQVIIQHQWNTFRGAGERTGQGGKDDTQTVQGVAYAVPNRAVQIFRDAGYMRGPLVG